MNPFCGSAENEVQGRAPFPMKDFPDSGLGARNLSGVGLRGLEKNVSPRPIEMHTCRTLAPSAPVSASHAKEGGEGTGGEWRGRSSGNVYKFVRSTGWPRVPSPAPGAGRDGGGSTLLRMPHSQGC